MGNQPTIEGAAVMDEHDRIAETVNRLNQATVLIGMTVSAVMVPGGWSVGLNGDCALPEGLPPLSTTEVLAYLNGFLTGFHKLHEALIADRNVNLN